MKNRNPLKKRLLWATFAFLTTIGLCRENPSGVSGYNYSKPVFEEGSRLLFIGDSITDMKWGRNEADRNHYLGHSYVFLIASRLHADLPKAKLEFFNRGKSGNTVGHLRERWQRDVIEMKPDILSILIGVNDVGRACRANQQVELKQWEADYRFILDASRKANPDLEIILLDPFVLRSGKLNEEGPWEQWSGECAKLRAIVKRLATDYEATHLQTQEIFDTACKAAGPSRWIWDGVHPLPQGHELIARNWIQAMAEAVRPLPRGE